MSEKLALAFNIDQHGKYKQYDTEWFNWNLGRLPEMIGYALGEPEATLDPFARCSTARGEFFIYPYGIVAICENEKADVIYRFD